MNKSVKLILSLLATITMIIVVTGVCLVFIIDVNDFKTNIETAAKNHLNRTLEIEGDIKLSIFPWLGVSTGKIRLYNSEHFNNQTFAEIESSELNVKLLPLLSKQLEISEIIFTGFKLKLVTNETGVNNWQDLIQNKKSKSNKKPLVILAVAGLQIEKAQIIWEDLRENKKIEIKPLNLQLGQLKFNQPIPITSQLKIETNQPQLKQKIKFSSHLVLNEDLTVFELQNSELQLDTQSPLLPVKNLSSSIVTNIRFDAITKQLKISSFDLHSYNLKLHSQLDVDLKTGLLTGSLNLAEFNPAQLMDKLNIQRPKMVDNKALNFLNAQFNFQADKNKLKLDQIQLKLDETTLTGDGEVVSYQQPKFNFNLNIDRLNVDRYLPPTPEKSKPKKAVHPATATITGANIFPVEQLRKLNITGDINIEELKLNNLNMQGIKLQLSANEGIFKTKQQIKQVYQGFYTGAMELDVTAKPPVIQLNEKLYHLELQQLLKDMRGESKLAGVTTVTAKLTAKGNNPQALKASLKGEMSLLIKNALFHESKLFQILQKTQHLNSEKEQNFSKITATAQIKNGLMSNRDLMAFAAKVRLKGSGDINLVSEQIDYLIKAHYDTRFKDLDSKPINIKLTGAINQPHYQLDLTQIATQENIDSVKEKVLEKLEDLSPEINQFLKKLF